MQPQKFAPKVLPPSRLLFGFIAGDVPENRKKIATENEIYISTLISSSNQTDRERLDKYKETASSRWDAPKGSQGEKGDWVEG